MSWVVVFDTNILLSALLSTNEIRAFSRVVPITQTLKVVAADPDDDKVLECAVAGNANFIVTGDRRHLLPLGTFQDIEIKSANDLLALLPPE